MTDPLAAPAQAAGVKGEVRIEEPDRAERAIARRSAESRAIVPDLELTAEVALGDPIVCADSPHTLTSWLVRACAQGLRAVPRANGAYRDGHFELYSRINVGVLIAIAETYAVPTVFDADRKSVAELSDEIAALERRACAGELQAPDLAGATFTLWNPGVLGIATATPMITPPQAAALAAGAIREVPVVRDEAIVRGHAMTITLACDHRILYGTEAARFLATIKAGLEEATP